MRAECKWCYKTESLVKNDCIFLIYIKKKEGEKCLGYTKGSKFMFPSFYT